MAYLDDIIKGLQEQNAIEKSALSQQYDNLLGRKQTELTAVPGQFDDQRAGASFNTAKAQNAVTERLSNLGYSQNSGLGYSMGRDIQSAGLRQMAGIGEAQNKSLQAVRNNIMDLEGQKVSGLADIDRQYSSQITGFQNQARADQEATKRANYQAKLKADADAKALETQRQLAEQKDINDRYNTAYTTAKSLRTMKSKVYDPTTGKVTGEKRSYSDENIADYIVGLNLDYASTEQLLRDTGVYSAFVASESKLKSKTQATPKKPTFPNLLPPLTNPRG
jgi:hypothetical protein